MSETPSLDLLIHELTQLPGVGEKTAQRFSHFILRSGKNYSEKLKLALTAVAEKIHPCSQCFSYTEGEGLCEICSNPHREDHLVCVVEEAFDISKVENSGAFKGRYHVLGGALSPLDGIHPENLKIQELVERVRSTGVKEIILALDADLEGDTTALYLAKVFKEFSIKLTRIAHGVPFGTDIDYIDRRTLGRALENRVEL